MSGTPGHVEREGDGASVIPAAPRGGIARRLRGALVGAPWPDSGRLTPHLTAYIEQVRPQLFYTLLGTLGMTQLVREIRDRFRLPVAVHFMDDYFATLYGGGLVSPLVRSRLRAVTNDVVDHAVLRLAIGDDMAKAYARRWHKSFEPVQNAVDVDAIVARQPGA